MNEIHTSDPPKPKTKMEAGTMSPCLLSYPSPPQSYFNSATTSPLSSYQTTSSSQETTQRTETACKISIVCLSDIVIHSICTLISIAVSSYIFSWLWVPFALQTIISLLAFIHSLAKNHPSSSNTDYLLGYSAYRLIVACTISLMSSVIIVIGYKVSLSSHVNLYRLFGTSLVICGCLLAVPSIIIFITQHCFTRGLESKLREKERERGGSQPRISKPKGRVALCIMVMLFLISLLPLVVDQAMSKDNHSPSSKEDHGERPSDIDIDKFSHPSAWDSLRKGEGYNVDESIWAHRCLDNLHCTGRRTCSAWGWCQGTQ